MRTRLRALCLAPLAGCLLPADAGPPLGRCAELPDGAYTYGEVGIGTCLSGPDDVRFHTVDGRLMLGVTNADPFRTFSSGSFLDLEAEPLKALRGTHTLDTLAARALPMERFVGAFALARNGTLAVIPSRLSEGSFFRGVDDRAWLVDLSGPEPTYAPRRFVQVGADPARAIEDPDAERVYVLNSTSVSVSVIDTRVDPPDLLDTAPASRVTDATWLPTAGSIGRGELRGQILPDDEIDVDDRWTTTWIEGAWRLWVPEGAGLARWTSGGLAYVRSGLGVEVDPGVTDRVDEVVDPFVGFSNDLLTLFYGDRGTIRTAFTDGHAGTWLFDPDPVLEGDDGWNDVVSAPAFADLDGRTVLFFEGRAAAGAAASIGRATTRDGFRFDPDPDPVLVPAGDVDSLEQPSVLLDRHTGAVRLWASARRGDAWSIVTATSSDDGTTWSAPVDVLTVPGGGAGAPFVTWTGGRYLMWLAVSDGTTWSHATAWSWDGTTWSTPRVVVPSDRLATERPPRVAVAAEAVEGWRVEGADAGVLSDGEVFPLAAAGTLWASRSRGFAFEVAVGHDVGTNDVPDAGSGVVPTSVAEPQGVRTMYATATDADGRSRLVALRELGDRWTVARDDLVPPGAGGNLDGARAPVVFRHDGRWQAVYAGLSGEVWSLFRATSDDGLAWTPAPLEVTGDRGSWEAVERRPHSLVVEDDGTFTLWYTGSEGNRSRIGALTSADAVTWTPQGGGDDPWVFGPGDPGAFDDTNVSDPMAVRDGATLTLWYTGDDGGQRAIGVATRTGAGAFTRRTRPLDDRPAPLLSAVPRTFAVQGVHAPVLDPTAPVLWYAGSDGFADRIGHARVDGEALWPEHRFPSSGDRFVFDTVRGVPGRSAIRLGQVVERVALPGANGATSGDGPASGVLDRARGFLYVGSKSFAGVLVVDVRDDSTADFEDRNAFDLEAVLRFDTTTGVLGVHDLVLAPNGLIYASVREPDAVWIVDPSAVVDDAEKQIVDGATVGTLPMDDLTDDDGDETFSAVGAAGLALVPDQDLLLVTHFRDNSLSVFDLSSGAHGEEIRYLDDLGEHPHLVRVAPDGTWAVVATYLGDSTLGGDASELLVLDLDPASPTWLEIVARIANR